MHRIIKAVIGGIVMLFSATTFGQVNYTVDFEYEDKNSDVKIYLINSIFVDTPQIVNGKGTFSKTLSAPDLVGISIDRKNGKPKELRCFFATGGNLKLKLTSEGSIIISGNKDAADCFHSLSEPISYFNNKGYELRQKLVEAKKQNADTVALQAEFIKNIDSCYRVPQNFIKSNPKSIVSVCAMFFLGPGKENGEPITIKDLEKMYMSLDEKVRNTEYGKRYSTQLEIYKQTENNK